MYLKDEELADHPKKAGGEMKLTIIQNIAAVAAYFLTVSTVQANEPYAIAIGKATGSVFTYAQFLSEDGATAAGSVLFDDGTPYGIRRVFRWTSANGMELFDIPAPYTWQFVAGISGDGSTLAGMLVRLDGSFLIEQNPYLLDPFGLRELRTMTPDLPPSGSVSGISSDGSTVIAQIPGGAYYWSASSGFTVMPAIHPLALFNQPTAVSANGSVIVGYSQIDQSDLGYLGYRWSVDTGFSILEDLPGGSSFALPRGVSGNGQFVAGLSHSDVGYIPVLWSEVFGTESLGVFDPLASDPSGEISDVTNDGHFAIGWAGTDDNINGYRGIVWERGVGLRSMQEFLETEYGLTFNGLVVEGGYSLTDNGRFMIVGTIDAVGDLESFLVHMPNTRLGSSQTDIAGGAGEAGGATIEFSNVTVAGETTVTVSDTGPTPPSGFRLVPVQTYYDITTTAQFTGTVEVCLSYDDASVANESNLKLMHYENGAWVNITTSLDTVNNVICGVTASLSPFIIVEEEPVLPVSIDIKPGSYPNSINLGSNGVVPVAIFGAADFDATQIDPTTVRLADAAVKVRGNGTSMAHFEDVNGDGRLDLVVQVSTQGLQLTASDTQAVLTAETADGRRVRGSDTVRVVN